MEFNTKQKNKILEMVPAYIAIADSNQYNELYKWETVNEFQDNFNLKTNDVKQMLELCFSKSANLLVSRNYYPLKMLYEISEGFPKETLEAFSNLFDEKKPISERIIAFRDFAKIKVDRMRPNKDLNTYQDDRAIAVFLTCMYPQKYTFYKARMFSGFAKKLGLKFGREKRLEQYWEFCEEVKNVLKTSDEYLKWIENKKQQNKAYDIDKELNIFVQDFIWISSKEEESDYWIFQCNPNEYDIVKEWHNRADETWRVSAHKDKIKAGDKVIIWVTGNKSGCYGLCEISSDIIESEIDYVHLSIENNLTTNPILKEKLLSLPEFSNFKGGNQGTNFIATKAQYEAILNQINGSNTNTKKYWLYQPGRQATYWDEFYNNGIICLGKDELGDTGQYKSKEEIAAKLQELANTESSKKNDATAHWEFANMIRKGDIIIAKKGTKQLIGLGEVEKEYYYDDKRDYYKKSIKVNWLKRGNWNTDFNLHLKTLTDITSYTTEHPDYQYYYERLLDVMDDNKTYKVTFPLNTILYGPPGTGKTYNSINYALGIVDGKNPEDYDTADKTTRKTYVSRFNQLKKEGQIEFITFHQNYAYEDFVQGIRPNLKESNLNFERKDGIFKNICTHSLFEYYLIKKELEKPKTASNVFDFDEVYSEWVENLRKKLPEVSLKTISGSKIILAEITANNNLNFTHENSSRLYTVSGGRLKKLFQVYDSISKIKNVHDDIRNAIGGCNTTVFWVALKDFIDFKDKYLESTTIDDTEQEYTLEDKVRLLKSWEWENETEELIKHHVKKYVLVIDEINRANISRVFGELISLIESDKRFGKTNELIATLPSGEPFVVPPNLYIIGTMNTADKSIALLDIALRRRFSFKAFYPNADLIIDENLKSIFIKLNEYIQKDKGSDFTIGHSYFMNKVDNDLPDIMNDAVIPLLTEYYMNDMDEVKNVLDKAGVKVSNGKGFLTYDEGDE